ncbi:CAAX prenyl protease 2 [Trichinella sp. T6]|nr:CAAX prenyl protease 2 [Trichinella sp. T6]
MVFRCCMVNVAASCFQPFYVVLFMPIYFAAAHLHHALDKTDFVCGWRDRLIITYLFGVYNTFIYLRTHHFISVFVCHALCNFIGFPEPEMYYSLNERWKRSVVLYVTFIGILLWMMSLYPLTDPSLYGNKFIKENMLIVLLLYVAFTAYSSKKAICIQWELFRAAGLELQLVLENRMCRKGCQNASNEH